VKQCLDAHVVSMNGAWHEGSERVAQFISVAPSQCSSALPSTKRHMSNQLVV
jgi:hypothetical protein